MRAIMPGILASLVNKALGSAADLSAIAAIPIATGAPCLPFLIAGLGMAAWDIFAARGQDGQLGNIDNDLQDALRKLRDILANTEEVQRRSLFAEVGQRLATDAIVKLEGIDTAGLHEDDERRPYLVLHRFLKKEFVSREDAERETRALIHGLRNDVIKTSQRLDKKSDAIFAKVCGSHALADAALVLDRMEEYHRENMGEHAKTQQAIRSFGENIDPLHRYFANLREQFATYENLGLPVPDRDVRDGEQDRPVLIRKLFVEPACTGAHFTPEAFDAVWEEKNPAQPLLPLLATEKARVVLLADPGMGKSTVIQYLIATLADEAVPPGAEALRGAVPLPFILRDLVSAMPAAVKEWTWDALVAAFRQWRHRGKGAPLAAPLTADDALFRATLASGRAFFLIDGLDEIGDPQRRTAIRDAIWEGFEKYPGARWLVTSRVVGYEQAAVDTLTIKETRHGSTDFSVAIQRMERIGVLKGARSVNPFTALMDVWMNFAKLLHLAPFDDPQQRAFAGNWFRPRLGEAAGTQRAEDFIEAVHRHSHTRVIGRVPNLLYLLALLYRHKAHLPDGRALVYAAISSAYLGEIDMDKHLPDSLVVAWKPEEKEELLSIVAMRMQELRVAQEGEAKGEILVTRAQLEEWLGSRFGGAHDPAACAELHRFLDHIANRTGLLLPRGEGVFGFAHLSFQEYYAASHLKWDFERIVEATLSGDEIPPRDLQLFEKLAAHPAWHEPLLFLVERLRDSAPFTGRLIKWMFPQLDRDNPAKGRGWMPITAAQLLAGISIDQEVNLDDAQRAKIWSNLWKAHIAAVSWEWNIAPFLIVTGNVYRTPSLEAAVSLRPMRFDLVGCTGVSDLHPLQALTSVQTLNLHGCTGVNDIYPLSALDTMFALFLNGCTGVSDLQLLHALAYLRKLWLNGCTGVSEEAVAALRAARPMLQIFGP